MSKTIMAVWAMIIVLICASLIFISNGLRDKVLFKLEKDIKVSTREYIKDNNIKISMGSTYIVNVSDLIEKEYLKEDENIEKYCIKTILVSRGIILKEYRIEKECEEKDN